MWFFVICTAAASFTGFDKARICMCDNCDNRKSHICHIHTYCIRYTVYVYNAGNLVQLKWNTYVINHVCLAGFCVTSILFFRMYVNRWSNHSPRIYVLNCVNESKPKRNRQFIDFKWICMYLYIVCQKYSELNSILSFFSQWEIRMDEIYYSKLQIIFFFTDCYDI